MNGLACPDDALDWPECGMHSSTAFSGSSCLCGAPLNSHAELTPSRDFGDGMDALDALMREVGWQASRRFG